MVKAQFFPHFPQIVAIFDDFSELFGFGTLKNHQVLQNCFKKMNKNLPIILLPKMTAFGTKNVHNALDTRHIPQFIHFVQTNFHFLTQSECVITTTKSDHFSMNI